LIAGIQLSNLKKKPKISAQTIKKTIILIQRNKSKKELKISICMGRTCASLLIMYLNLMPIFHHNIDIVSFRNALNFLFQNLSAYKIL
jgi:hypothetical protein